MVNCGRYCSLTLSDFGFRSTTFEDFTRSQWTLHTVILLLYRIVVSGYFFGYQLYVWICIFDITYYIYMTYLTYTVFTIYNLIALSNVLTDLIVQNCFATPRRASNVFTVRYMVQWLFYDVTITWTWVVMVVYWGALFNIQYASWLFDITCHLLPAVFSLLDLWLTATPCRLAHAIYPMIYGLIYLTLTLIYWATGHDPIYSILDYSGNPALAAGSIVGMFGLMLVVHTLMWGMTHLRGWLARRFHCYPTFYMDNVPTELIDSPEP